MTADVIQVGMTEVRMIQRLKLDTARSFCYKDKLGSNGNSHTVGFQSKRRPSLSKSHVYPKKKEEQKERN